MKIVNIICSGNLNCSINIEKLQDLGSSRFIYNPKSYHGGYLIFSKGKVTIYKSGKYILIGLKSLDDVIPVYKEMITVLSKFFDVSNAQEPVVQNIVISYDFQKQINLNKFLLSVRSNNIEYEPEQFPGLIFRDKECSALLFRNGKCVFTKAKRLDQVEKTRQKIENILDSLG